MRSASGWKWLLLLAFLLWGGTTQAAVVSHLGSVDLQPKANYEDANPVLFANNQKQVMNLAWIRTNEEGASSVYVSRFNVNVNYDYKSLDIRQEYQQNSFLSADLKSNSIVSHLQANHTGSHLAIGIGYKFLFAMDFYGDNAGVLAKQLPALSVHQTPRAVTFGSMSWVNDKQIGMLHLANLTDGYPDLFVANANQPGPVDFPVQKGNLDNQLVSVGKCNAGHLLITRDRANNLKIMLHPSLTEPFKGGPSKADSTRLDSLKSDSFCIESPGITTNIAISPRGDQVAYLKLKNPEEVDPDRLEYSLFVFNRADSTEKCLLVDVRATRGTPAWTGKDPWVGVITQDFEAKLVHAGTGETLSLHSDQAISAYDLTACSNYCLQDFVAVSMTNKANNRKRINLFVIK